MTPIILAVIYGVGVAAGIHMLRREMQTRPASTLDDILMLGLGVFLVFLWPVVVAAVALILPFVAIGWLVTWSN